MTLSEVQLAFRSIENDLKEELKTLSASKTQNLQLQALLEAKMKNWPRDLSQRLSEELFGLGPLKELLDSEEFTEILVLDFDNILVEQNGRLTPYPDQFLSNWTFRNCVERLFSLLKTQCDLSRAAVDAHYKNFRVHVIQRPLVSSDYQLSFRRHPLQRWSFDKLLTCGFLNREQADQLSLLIEEKKNMIIVGPTGSGKTTLLKACLNEVENTDRVVVIEDTHEIEPPNTFSTHLLARESENLNLKSYTLGDLLRQSLRMRPDRLVVGEVRGGEAKELLMALSTGHQGSFGTLHAGSAQEALFRLEFLIQMGAPQWSLESLRRLIFLSLQNIVVVGHQERRRKLKGIYSISSMENSGLLLEQFRPRSLKSSQMF